MAIHGKDVYALGETAPSEGASRPIARATSLTTLAGTIALPMLLAISLAALAWALPGQGDSQAVAVLGVAGLAGATGFAAYVVIATAAERRARELETLRSEEAALRAELAAVAQDIRDPLVTANSYFELLASEAFGRLPAEAREAAERGRAASERARSLAEAKLQRSQQAGAAATPGTDLNALLGEVLVGLSAELAATEADVELRALPSADAERDALFEVFTKLVENALGYAPPGRKPRILISGYDDSDYVSISVRDWGPGIARREQEQVAALVERGLEAPEGADADALDAELGLGAVRRLVHEQGGRVWIDPLVTDGTSVRIALPSAKA